MSASSHRYICAVTTSWHGEIRAARLCDARTVCAFWNPGQACQKTGWCVDAYVLMGNHYHLLVETPEGNLVAGMKWLQEPIRSVITAGTVFGHLFQGRYKAVVIDGSSPDTLKQSAPTFI